MNIEEYISSGILELYALDLLSKAERREVEYCLKEYPEVSAELRRIEIDLEKYAHMHGKTPPSQFKSKLLNKLEYADENQIDVKSKVIFLRWIAAAASVLLIMSLGLNFYQINKINKTEDQLANLKSEQSILAEENANFKAKNEEFRASLAQAEEQVSLFQHPDVKTIKIKGSDLSPGSYAYVNYNQKTKEVAINGLVLPENGPKNQYQLWALVDGTPVDLGVFDSSDSLIKLSKTVENPDAFAVTLQDRGGNETPNLEQLYLIGNV